jgi:nucleoside-diphosphate-sugar epimerase
MPGKKRVLITGPAGLIGGILREALSAKYELSGVYRRPVPGLDTVVADMTRLDAIQPAFEDKDVVIDLANKSSADLDWNQAFANNMPSTHNMLEAARRAGVGRVIFASSNHATGMYESDFPYSAIVSGKYDGLDPSATPYITTGMPVRPDGPYGVGKAFSEAISRYYSDRHGLSVICLRIGTVNQEDRPQIARHFATLQTHRDLVHQVERCIEAPDDLRFAIFYGVSDNRWRFWDISDAQEAIGYDPQDDAEVWREGGPGI